MISLEVFPTDGIDIEVIRFNKRHILEPKRAKFYEELLKEYKKILMEEIKENEV
ncbi:unnamed protein product [marine sediment metagenome]|uniref:Uncharacterized protein n=1 Tax=marine sediment metagenome TaxID=412755 RepID=X1I745_9ZZZZ